MKSDHLRGIMCMVGAMALISVQEAFAKYLSQTLPVAQVVWARYLGHLLLMTILLWPKYGATLFKSSRLSLQIGRSLILLVDTGCFFFGLTMIGLAEATAIFFTVPLLVLILSMVFLSERVRISAILAVIAGFVGTLVIILPGIDGSVGTERAIGALLIFAAACCTAIYNVSTRKLSHADPLGVTLFFTAMVGAVISSVFIPFIWQSPETMAQWAALIVIGFFGGLAHSLIIIAHQYTQASTVAPFMYSQIFWALGLGWLMFGEMPDGYAYLGGGIVILSGLYLIRYGRADAQSPQP